MRFTKEVKPNLHRAERLFFFRPVFFTALFLCLGIAFAYWMRFSHVSSFWLLLGFPLLFIVCASSGADSLFKNAVIISLCLIGFFVGFLSLEKQLDDFIDTPTYTEERIVQGTLIQNNVYGELTVFKLSDLYIDGERTEGELTSYLSTSYAEKYQIGDKLLLRGETLTDVEFFDKYGFRAEDIKTKSRYYIRDVEVVKTGESNNPFLRVRERIREVVYAGMDEDAAAITLGVLLGDTSGIAEDLYDNIRFGGIAHIFAVSGLHVGALFAFCMLLVKKTRGKIPKPIRFFLVAFVLAFYAGVCGFSSSVVRASVICLTFYAFSLCRLHADFLERLGFAALLILFFNPVALFEVGFQLSFLACLGLALFASPIQKGLNRLLSGKVVDPKADDKPLGVLARIKSGGISLFSLSIAAQTFTAPVMMKHFSYLSGWGLLLNILFVPLISAVFSLLLLLVLIACALPLWCSTVLLFAPNAIFHALLLLFEIFDFSTFAITGLNLTGGGLVCWGVGTTVLSDKCNLRAWQKGIISALFLSVFLFSTVFVNL